MSAEAARRYVPAILIHVAVLAAWYAFVTYGHVPSFIMPTPLATVATLAGANYDWIGNTLVTTSEIFGGYFLAVAVGVSIAIVFSWSRATEAAVMPLLVSLNMIPKVALGPLFIVWFSYGIFPNTIIAFSISFFPILLNTARGFREVEPDLLDLVRSLRSSKWQTFIKIQLPSALPYIFSGMKVGAILAVAGAIVGEFLGSSRGLGYLMLQVQVSLDTAGMFMAVILITLVGIILYGMVLGLERLVIVQDARVQSSPPVAEPFIRVSALRKVYRKGDQEFLAIDDASFEVAAGELVSLVGPSGCGKTTLLKILAGLQDYDSGQARIGSAAHPFDPSRDIGMVFQQPLLLKWRRVLQNVILPAEILGLPLGESRARARDLLAMVGLAGFEDKYPYELSGGMQQRAAIARALIHDPKLILMDEPFGALDALTREKMNLELLNIWKQSGKTILFVTHGIAEAVFLGTRVLVLTAGPARMADNIKIALPSPRTLDLKTSEAFGEYSRRIYHLLGMG